MKKTFTVISINTFPAIALAIKSDDIEDITMLNTTKTAGDIIVNIITYILSFSAAIAVLFLIIGGIRYIASQGNTDTMEKAKHTILYAVIGLLVIVLSYVIVRFIGNQLATNITGKTGTKPIP